MSSTSVPNPEVPEWRLSKKNNPWTIFHGYTLTVFRAFGRWQFCLCENSLLGPEYYGKFDSMEEAKEAARLTVLSLVNDEVVVVVE